MSSRRADAFSRLVDRWPAAVGVIGEWERIATGYSDGEVADAAEELLLADQGPGVPFEWRWRKALQDVHRNGKTKAAHRAPRGWHEDFYRRVCAMCETGHDPGVGWLCDEHGIDAQEAMRRGRISGPIAEIVTRLAEERRMD